MRQGIASAAVDSSFAFSADHAYFQGVCLVPGMVGIIIWALPSSKTCLFWSHSGRHAPLLVEYIIPPEYLHISFTYVLVFFRWSLFLAFSGPYRLQSFNGWWAVRFFSAARNAIGFYLMSSHPTSE